MKLFFIGPPAAGKTVVAQDMANRYGLHHLSSGEIARNLAERDEYIKNTLAAGNYAPADVMDRVMLTHILAVREPQAIDGYPRYFEQLLDIVTLCDTESLSFVVLTCDEDVLRARHAERGKLDVGEFDARMKRYHDKTAPMVNWLKRHRRTFEVSTSQFNRPDVTRLVTEKVNEMNGYPNNIPLVKVW